MAARERVELEGEDVIVTLEGPPEGIEKVIRQLEKRKITPPLERRKGITHLDCVADSKCKACIETQQ